MSQQEEQIECWFLIPILRNSVPREKHPTELWDVFHKCLRDLFHALSGPVDVFRERVKIRAIEYVRKTPGSCPNEQGEIINDESRKYTLLIAEHKVDDLREFLEKVANSFDQDEILCVVRGVKKSVLRRKQAGFLDGDLWSE